MKEEIRIGDWVVALKDLSGTGQCIKGSLYKVKELGTDNKTISVYDEWVKDGYEYAGWTSIENFRKANPEEIAAHLAKKETITAERIKELFKNESMPHGLAKSIADLLTASGVTYVTGPLVDEKQEPKWTPAFGEEVLVWDEGYKERKTYYYLGEVNNQHLCSRFKINGNRGQNIEATSWERMSSKTAKVKVTMFEAQEELGKIYGVSPEQIEIV